MGTDKKNEDTEIDLLEIFGLLMARAGIIILTAILGLVVAFGFTKLFITPQYQSSTEIYVINNTSGQASSEQINVNDLQSSSYLTKDYVILAKSRPVLNQVISELKLDMTVDALEAKLSVSAYTDTRIIKLAVTDPDPLEAKKLVDAITNAAIAHIESVIGVDSVKLSNGEGNVPTSPVSPNLKLNSILGFLVGFVLAAGIVIARFLLDDSIKTQEDVEKYLGLSVLGLIPEIEGADSSKKKKKKKKK